MDEMRDRFDEYLKAMCANNYFAVFLNEMIYLEFALMRAEELITSIDMDNFVGHEIPYWSNIPEWDNLFNGLQFVTLNTTGYCEGIKNIASPKTASLEEFQRYYDDVQQVYNREHEKHGKKQTGTVKIILRLAKNFAEEMKKIRDETGIPIASLRKIYLLMTSFYLTLNNPLAHIKKPFEDYNLIAIQDMVPVDERDRYVFNISKRMYDLLLECYWVLYVSAMYELIMIIGIFQKYDLGLTKKYLYHAAVYPEHEELIWRITNDIELREYLDYVFYSFFKFLPEFSDAVHAYVENIAAKRMKHWDTEIHAALADVSVKVSSGQNDRGDNDNGDGGDDDWMSKMEWEEWQDSPNIEASPMTQTMKEEYRQSRNANKLSFIGHLLAEVSSKNMLAGPLANYKLKGSSKTPLNYLKKLLKNAGFSLISSNYDELTKSQYGISARTRRRYKKDFLTGKVATTAVANNSNKPEFSDLTLEHINKIRDEQLRLKYHRQEGYLSQNQLIEHLMLDGTIRLFNQRTGLQFKKYSRPTLMKKLNILIQLEKIVPLKMQSTCLYEATEQSIFNIIREIINISDKKK